MSIYLGTSPIANTGYDKANTNLSNLTNTGKNIANWSNNVTNCITEIPQDIKLELNNGTLTLKAGSKVYVPNGSGTYNAVTVASDIGSGSISGISADYMFFLNPSRTGQAGSTVSNCYSGASAPSNPSNGWFWYDTTNNSVKRWSGSAWVDGFSLPFCIITSGASSIKQVFNGFGYIGSTIFALPSVKGLIPNGRNADGTLRNIEFTLNGVQTVSLTTQTFTNRNFVLRNGDMGFSSVVYYDAVNNTNYNFSAYMIAATGSVSSGKITSFTPKTAFHAVDYNDFNNIPHIVETYVNGTSWYRVYSDGWCEQGGHWNSSSNSLQTITLLKPYKDTNYNVQVTVAHTGATYTSGAAPCYYSAAYKTVSSFQCYGYSDASLANKDWMACGYIN